ncbi:MAG TPA: ClbS/DfsB family four-helix bundle protein [Anaerolineales bacterium]|nr:ClbS/DfsB family four-helix bundle protein [Anaerolineales bacterium]
MASDEKNFLIERWESRREALKALISQAEAHREKEIYRGWRLKEFLAHMSGWDDAVIESLRAHAEGIASFTPAARGVDAYNAQTVSTRETLDYDRIRREWDRSHELVMEALRNLPDEKFHQTFAFAWGESGTAADLVEIFAGHEQEHAAHLREWLKNPNEVFAEEH